MQDYVSTFHQLFIAEIKRRLFEENQARVIQCLNSLTEAEIWYRPNENSNSVGNLVLHLCGNITQWVIAGLGATEDTRQRQAEFDEQGPIETKILLEQLQHVMTKVEEVIDKLTPEQLITPKAVQGFQENGISILVHVTEHFSYHVGQMTYFVKSLKNKDMGYYAGLNLDQK
jgi:uncharacterized damage-inducible protein DinB